MAVKKKRKLTPLFFLALPVMCFFFVLAVYLPQERKLNDIAKQKAALELEYNILLNEEQRLSYMIEYAQSDEYKLQFAREKLGLVHEDDIKFSISDNN